MGFIWLILLSCIVLDLVDWIRLAWIGFRLDSIEFHGFDLIRSYPVNLGRLLLGSIGFDCVPFYSIGHVFFFLFFFSNFGGSFKTPKRRQGFRVGIVLDTFEPQGFWWEGG